MGINGVSIDRAISLLGVLTAATLVVALASLQRTTNELRTEGEFLREIAYLDRLRLETLGRPLPTEVRAVVDPEARPALSGPSVLWIVDPTDCPVCAEEARLLNRTVIGVYPRVVVILSGVSAAQGQEFAEGWGLRAAFTVDPEGDVRRSMRLVLPSNFLVLNQAGLVVHVDAHRGTQPCRNDVLELARRLLESPAGEITPAQSPSTVESSS